MAVARPAGPAPIMAVRGGDVVEGEVVSVGTDGDEDMRSGERISCREGLPSEGGC